ncbi:hypothetical protein ACJX0J_021813, partial [Zea mays]
LFLQDMGGSFIENDIRNPLWTSIFHMGYFLIAVDQVQHEHFIDSALHMFTIVLLNILLQKYARAYDEQHFGIIDFKGTCGNIYYNLFYGVPHFLVKKSECMKIALMIDGIIQVQPCIDEDFVNKTFFNLYGFFNNFLFTLRFTDILLGL